MGLFRNVSENTRFPLEFASTLYVYIPYFKCWNRIKRQKKNNK